MSNEIGKKLKALRQSRKLTQEEVAIKAKITRSTISNYELGRRTPHLKDLQRLSAIFNVGLDYFNLSQRNEAFELLARAKEVFENKNISKETKEELYKVFMKLYLSLSEGN